MKNRMIPENRETITMHRSPNFDQFNGTNPIENTANAPNNAVPDSMYPLYISISPSFSLEFKSKKE